MLEPLYSYFSHYVKCKYMNLHQNQYSPNFVTFPFFSRSKPSIEFVAWLPNHSSLFGRSNPDHQITVSSIVGHPYGYYLCLNKINPCTTCFGSAGAGWVTQLFHSGKTPNLAAIRSPLRRHYGVETTIGANQPRFTFDQGKHCGITYHVTLFRN